MPVPAPSAEASATPGTGAPQAPGAPQVPAAPRPDPVRLRFIQALTRRAAAHGPAVQAALQPRLQQALAELAELAQRRPQAVGTPASAAPPARFAATSPLGSLLATLNREAPGNTPGSMPGTSPNTALPASTAMPAELKALSQFRSTWAGLSVDQQLVRSLAQAPENPGPLNSHRMVLRTLQTLQTLSPAYLQRFLAHADALMWLEHLSAAQAPATSPAPRRERKPPRPKPAPARTRAR